MKRTTWLKQQRWLLSGLALACLALVIVAIIWLAQEHQYQLALAHYNAAYQPYRILNLPGGALLENPSPTDRQ